MRKQPTKADGSNRLLDHTSDLIFIRFQILCNKQLLITFCNFIILYKKNY